MLAVHLLNTLLQNLDKHQISHLILRTAPCPRPLTITQQRLLATTRGHAADAGASAAGGAAAAVDSKEVHVSAEAPFYSIRA